MSASILHAFPGLLMMGWGPAAIVGVFLAAAIGILLIPKELIGQADRVPWWKNVRFWAVTICVVQMVVYWVWG